MPYIVPEQRDKVDAKIDALIHEIMLVPRAHTPGVLNYTMTRLLKTVYSVPNDQHYHKYNEIIGILECCKLEFYRALVALYEDIKRKDNGDV